jgi:ABC-type multidrug transport system fused ATPase/permease subunit
LKTFLRVFRFLLVYKYQFIAVLIGSILLGFFGALTMAVIKPVMTVLFEEQTQTQVTQGSGLLPSISSTIFSSLSGIIITPNRYDTLVRLSLFIIGMFVVKNIIKYLHGILYSIISEKLIRDIRYTVFSSLIHQPMAYFHATKTGDLISILTGEVGTIHAGMMPFLMVIIRNPVEIILLLLILFSLSVKLTLIAFSTSIITLFLVQNARKYLRKYASRMADSTAGIMSTMQEGISGIRVIKAFVAEDSLLTRFTSHANHYMRSSLKMNRVNDLIPAINEIVAIGALSVVLYVGGLEVFSGQMKGSDLMTFLFALFAIMSPISAMVSIPGQIQRGIVAAERVFQVIDTKPTIIDGDIEAPTFEHELSFNHVSFSYDDKRTVLNNISLKIPKGKTIAVVGSSGSGKSTLIDLVVRFYDPKSGTISMDGNSIKNFTSKSYRSKFGIVSQEAILFNDSIANNIDFANNGLTRTQIVESAKIAHAHEFIQELPDGYDTTIGDRGVLLSGGQRQRIAIARAVALNPDILIFDEATSALDSKSEKLVQEAINDVLKNRTAIIIAHRLSTIVQADSIVVFDSGNIVEQGTHQELLSLNGTYARLYMLQTTSSHTNQQMS